MSAEKPALVTVFKVGKYTAEVTVPKLGGAGCISCEWSPNVPETLTASEYAEYNIKMAAIIQRALQGPSSG